MSAGTGHNKEDGIAADRSSEGACDQRYALSFHRWISQRGQVFLDEERSPLLFILKIGVAPLLDPSSKHHIALILYFHFITVIFL